MVGASPENRAAIACQLDRGPSFRFEVDEAGTGHEALEAITAGSYDCLLLDTLLPGDDGLALLDELQDGDGELPCTVVMATGHGDETMALEALERGVEDCIAKDLLRTAALQGTIANAVARRRMRDRLRSRERELRMFVERAAHDLRTPAKHIALLADMLLARMPDGSGDPYVGDKLCLIARSARHLDRLMRAIQSFTDAARMPLERQEVALDEVLGDVCEVLSEQISEAGARIAADALPVVRADPDGMALVLQNLIANAVKFRGGEPPLIRVTARDEREAWRVTVADNGIGLAPADRTRVFQPFVRGGDHAAYEGTGLGLATCRTVVEAHGGEIWVDAEVETGTTIHFTLPKG